MKPQRQDLIEVAILKGLVKINKHHTLYLPGEIGLQAMLHDAGILLEEVRGAIDKIDRGGAERE